jgi:hypothetical protein
MAGAPYIVWSPDGETPPKIRFDSHKAAHAAAWGMAKVFPGRQFFVMAKCGKGAMVEPIAVAEQPA